MRRGPSFKVLRRVVDSDRARGTQRRAVRNRRSSYVDAAAWSALIAGALL